MVDFEKVYSIKFETVQAARRLNRLREVIEKIETSKLQSVFASVDKSLHNVERSAKDTSDTIARGFNRAAREVPEATSALEILRKKAAQARKEIERTAERWTRIANGANAVGRKLTTFVTLPIIGAGVAAVKFARDFNAGMANVSTLIPGQTARVQELRKSILQMSADSGKSLEDLTNGLYETISAYGDNEDTVKRLDVATKAALAGRAETLDAVKLLSAVTKAYGDTSGTAQEKISDLAFMTVKLGQTTFPELAASMGKVTPLAAALNISQEELFGTFATLTGVTGDAAEVSTQYASILRAMVKPSEKLTEFASAYGFESAAAMVKSQGLAKTIKQMGEYAKGNEGALLGMLRRGEALTAVLALTGGQADTFNEKLGEMGGALGATEEAFREQTEGINKTGHSFEKTKQKLIGLAIRIGDRLLPVVDKILTKLEPLIKHFEDADDATLAWWGSLIKWAALSGPILRILSTMATPLIGLNKAIKLAALNTDQLGTAAATNAPKVGTMSKSLVGLQGALGVATAAFAGIAFGKMLDDTIFEPMRLRIEKLDDQISGTLLNAKMLLKQLPNMDLSTPGEREVALEKIDKNLKDTQEKKRALAGQKTSRFFSPIHDMAALVTGEDTAATKMMTEMAQLNAQEQQLTLAKSQLNAAQLTAGVAPSWTRDKPTAQSRDIEKQNQAQRDAISMAAGVAPVYLQQKAAAPSRRMRQQKRGASPLPPSNINITVNARSDNPRGIARETAKKFREVERDLRRTGDGISESEF